LVPIDQPRATATLFRSNGTDANNRVTANIAAVYLQDQVALSPQWKLIGGLRYDHFQANLDDRRTTLTANTTPTSPTDLARTDRAFSPRLGVVWSPASNASYYASYSTSFLPSAETLSLTVLNRSTGISTADFEPENARNYELGAHWDLAPRLTLSGAIFRLDRNHVRNADGNGGFIQSGQQRTQGFEMGLQGEVTRDWKVYAGYAHLDAQITRATAAAATLGHVPALVPKDTLSVWNRVALSAAWGAGLGVVHQGASFPNVDNTVKLPGFTRADGALFYALDGGHAHMALNVENLLDRKYFPTSDANNNISVGSPRTARLTVRTPF
jgi:catecholate siderophore receptor